MPDAFTGRARRRKTRASVRVADRISKAVITIGGIGTILAVVLIVVFLIWVVSPLFSGADIGESRTFAPEAGSKSRILRLAVDDFGVVAWDLREDGVVRLRRLDTGEVIDQREIFPAGSITAVSLPAGSDEIAIGLHDGRVVLGGIGFETDFHEPDAAGVPDELRSLDAGDLGSWDRGIVQRTPSGQLRRQTLLVEFDEPIQAGASVPVVGIDRSDQRRGPVFCALTADGGLHVRTVRLRKNLMTGEVVRRVRGTDIDVELPEGKGLPQWVVLSGLADNVTFVWDDGHLVRTNIRNLSKPRVAEVIDVLPEEGARVTSLGVLIGKSTLLIGDDLSHIRTWFLATSPTGETIDGMSLVMAHRLEGTRAPVTALGASGCSRLVAAGYGDGAVRLFHVTSEKLLGEVMMEEGAVDAVALFPRDDGLVATSSATWRTWEADPGYPEATLGALFTEVWYEGYAEPEHVWQSSGATDDFEMKLGTVPLVFGTAKATLYSMLFAIPLALLAAIYTSEFLNPRTRPRVKAVVEVMASLPSVVLGFLAALVLAPFIEEVVPAVLLCFLTIPFAFLLAAHLWQLLPRRVTLGLERRRLGFIALALPIGISMAVLLGSSLERVFFAGDVKLWLDGQIGGAVGGWALLLLPGSILLAVVFFLRFVGPRVRGLSEGGAARFALVRLFIVAVGALLLAGSVGFLLEWMGIDPRGGLVGTYVQRNAMVVGIAMGFAVIPIIYTIAEDALSAVPDHLRAASLGAGATPWQTAVRVIVPTAASGLFSACMIGLGRAVGETMIVLMAAGNTPLMEWNPFNGLRTLSANIAVEMPEAVRDSTHYRVLFLAGLTLFALTFVVNTIAEVIRLRFRRRAFQL